MKNTTDTANPKAGDSKPTSPPKPKPNEVTPPKAPGNEPTPPSKRERTEGSSGTGGCGCG